jgi:predicted enzyme related to lactoylglutathione lyase
MLSRATRRVNSDTPTPMPTARKQTPIEIKHFAINADDVSRARRFYERVFGWRFEAWGPPNFLQIFPGPATDSGIRGALQGRRELIDGQRTVGFECSFGVDDVDAVTAAVIANGGSIIIPKTLIPTVGYLIFFRDTEGNAVGAMQYDSNAGREVEI